MSSFIRVKDRSRPGAPAFGQIHHQRSGAVLGRASRQYSSHHGPGETDRAWQPGSSSRQAAASAYSDVGDHRACPASFPGPGSVLCHLQRVRASQPDSAPVLRLRHPATCVYTLPPDRQARIRLCKCASILSGGAFSCEIRTRISIRRHFATLCGQTGAKV